MATYLLTLKQGDSESLQDFLSRFNHEKLMVDVPNETLVLAALISSILPRSSFMKELAHKPPHTLQQFMDKVAKHINAAVTIRAFQEQHAKRTTTSEQKKCREPPREPQRKNMTSPLGKTDDSNHSEPKERQPDFTPFNAPATQMLLLVQDDKDIL